MNKLQQTSFACADLKTSSNEGCQLPPLVICPYRQFSQLAVLLALTILLTLQKSTLILNFTHTRTSHVTTSHTTIITLYTRMCGIEHMRGIHDRCHGYSQVVRTHFLSCI